MAAAAAVVVLGEWQQPLLQHQQQRWWQQQSPPNVNVGKKEVAATMALTVVEHVTNNLAAVL